MKTILLTMLLTLSVYSATEADADKNYAQRAKGPEFAKNAASLYEEVASKESNPVKKAELLYKQAQAIYYYGTQQKSDNVKEKIHEQGYIVSARAVNLLEGRGDTASEDFSGKVVHGTKALLAKALYEYSSNLGKWGEARGVLASLGQWPKLKAALNLIVGLGEEGKQVHSYGAYRILGRAYMKVPYESKQQAEEYLKEAYVNTTISLDGGELKISNNSTNVFYYLDILRKNDNKKSFCYVMDSWYYFVDLATNDESILNEYNPEMIPETKIDLETFEQEFSEVVDYYDQKC